MFRVYVMRNQKFAGIALKKWKECQISAYLTTIFSGIRRLSGVVSQTFCQKGCRNRSIKMSISKNLVFGSMQNNTCLTQILVDSVPKRGCQLTSSWHRASPTPCNNCLFLRPRAKDSDVKLKTMDILIKTKCEKKIRF